MLTTLSIQTQTNEVPISQQRTCLLVIFQKLWNPKNIVQHLKRNTKKFRINSSLCTVPFMPFLKCPSAMPFLKCPSAMPFLNCPSRIRFLKMPFLNYFPPKDALPQNSFPKKCPSLTCPPTIPHQRQCKHCNN